MTGREAQFPVSPFRRSITTFCLLCFFLMLLPAAIVLRPLQSDEAILIESPEETIDLSSTRIPAFTMAFSIKAPGFGQVVLKHTPLMSGLNRIDYVLVCEEGNPINFRSSAIVPEDVVFGHVWAILDRPLHTDDYLSTVWVHQVVER